ncbi:hypothetical protein [Halomonas sp. KO116]|uniref:hypothetical protein n=1 Tax=Halomonas sp. KO116 TaxID=1504981 RepID=UPI0004E349F4|nr:hypothetical protein [Halomonas sp. KO116]AJY53259.1 hypothetical protein KO116_P200152 [Halomonas sp. KO116]
MLTVNRRHSIHKQFQATRDRQICRAWRVERHDKTGRQHRSARWVLAITGLRKPTCTGRMIKKCSLAVIGKVSAPASRIQVNAKALLDSAMKSPTIIEDKRISIIPLYGVDSNEIAYVKNLIRINELEKMLSAKRPYYTLMEADSRDVSTNGTWVRFSGGSNIVELALQELTNGKVTPEDETIFSQILNLLPPQYNLIVRSV